MEFFTSIVMFWCIVYSVAMIVAPFVFLIWVCFFIADRIKIWRRNKASGAR